MSKLTAYMDSVAGVRPFCIDCYIGSADAGIDILNYDIIVTTNRVGQFPNFYVSLS